MKDFLEEQKDTQMHKGVITQLHKITKPQKHKSVNVKSCNYTQDSNESERDNDKLERIHVQIRKDLADKLIEMVYVRKRQGKKATQRHIIEQALKEYFAK
jgi:ethanolamine utilization protein EutQ (cupin superfamily)